MADFVVSLRQHEYQTNLGALRNYLQNLREGHLDIELKLPTVDTAVHLQLPMRTSSASRARTAGITSKMRRVVGKKLRHRQQLQRARRRRRDDIMSADNLSSLSKYKSGSQLDTRLVVMAAAVISESLRFATVTTYFTGLFNGLYKTFNLNQIVPSASSSKSISCTGMRYRRRMMLACC